MRPLVLAPRFPAINQPWIDTYLEQLLVNGADPVIVSSNLAPSIYHRKVDLLGLRTKTVPIALDSKSVIRTLIRSRPTARAICRCWRAVWQAMPFDRSSSFLRSVYLSRLEESRGPFDLIHSHAEIAGYQFLPLSILWKIPLVVSFHGLPPAGVGQLSHRKRALLYRRASAVLVNTQFAKSQVVSLGCPADKVVVLPQGIPLDDFPYTERSVSVGCSIRLLTVGRCDRQKGYGYALLALRRMLDAGLRVHWTFVGEGADMPRIKQLATKLGVGSALRIVPTSDLDGLRELYRNSDLFVLPSIPTAGWQETQGVVLQEAQATGCIAIATRTGGIPECISDQRDGLLVKPKSSRAIFDAVRYLITNDAVSEKLRRAGRERVEREFSADKVGTQMGDLLKGLSFSA